MNFCEFRTKWFPITYNLLLIHKQNIIDIKEDDDRYNNNNNDFMRKSQSLHRDIKSETNADNDTAKGLVDDVVEKCYHKLW